MYIGKVVKVEVFVVKLMFMKFPKEKKTIENSNSEERTQEICTGESYCSEVLYF